MYFLARRKDYFNNKNTYTNKTGNNMRPRENMSKIAKVERAHINANGIENYITDLSTKMNIFLVRKDMEKCSALFLCFLFFYFFVFFF